MPLTSRNDGRQNLAGFRGAEDEYDVTGRLLQGFQEGIRSLVGEHMGFVNDIDFTLAFYWRKVDLVANVANVIDASIARRVEFDNIHVAAIIDRGADSAGVTGVAALRVKAVDCLRQYPSRSGLSCPSGAAE